MPVIFDRAIEPAVIRLEGEIDIAVAAELRAALLEALASPAETHLSLAKVTCMDITALQLLQAAERETAASGKALVREGLLPETLRAGFRGAGFARFPFDDAPEAVPGVRS